MKKPARFLSLLFFIFIFSGNVFVHAQSDFFGAVPDEGSIEEMLTMVYYDVEIQAEIGLTEEQMATLQSIQKDFRLARIELRGEFIYPDDFEAEMTRLQEDKEARLLETISSENIETLRQYWSTREALQQAESEANRIQNTKLTYPHLDLTDEQALVFSEKVDGYGGQVSYDEFREKCLDEVLTEEQRSRHAEKLAADEKARAETDQNIEEEKYPEIQQYEADEEMRQMKPVLIAALRLTDEYFIPERAIVRAKLEKELTPSEQQFIEELRVKYADAWAAAIAKKTEKRDLAMSFGLGGDTEMIELMESFEMKIKRDFVRPSSDVEHNDHLRDAVATDRTTFYDAKALAIRYDEKIDNLQREVDLVFVSFLEQIITQMPAEMKEKENIGDIRDKFLQQKYQTPEVEYYRNLAFLLIEPADLDDEKSLSSDRLAHSLLIYPIPANDVQTLSFETTTTGWTEIDLLSQDGKLLKKFFSGELAAGQHVMEVPVSDIAADVFYYHVSGPDGVSVAKSVKGN